MRDSNGTRAGSMRFALVLCAILALQGCAEAVVVSGVGGLAVMHDARSVKDRFHDHAIEKAARHAIAHDQELKEKGSISVASFNRTVLITGEVSSTALKNHLTRLVGKLGKVRRIHNEVKVVATPRGNSWTRDGFMAARIKARLFFRDFDATRVRVVSDLGNVYLMGLVSHAESDQVAAMVADVDGIRSVTKVFEYVD